jgi:hypothetical protein
LAVENRRHWATGVDSVVTFQKSSKEWLGNNFKKWPSFSQEQAAKMGKQVYLRMARKYQNVWEKTTRLVRGPPKTSPELLAQITDEVISELRKHRKVYEGVKKDPNYLKNLLEEGRINKKGYRSLKQRLKEDAKRFFPDPDAIPKEQLDLLVARIIDDIFAEGNKYNLKKDIMIYRAKKRIKSAITTNDVYTDFLGRSTPPRLVSGAEALELSKEQLSALSNMYDDVMALGMANC